MRLSSLRKVSRALDLPESGIELLSRGFLGEDKDSLCAASVRIMEDGSESWPLHLFNFVDAFRRRGDVKLVASPPSTGATQRIQCLLTSTMEAVCAEKGVPVPAWSRGVPALQKPWFVSGIESLKAMTLVQSPIHFRKRNIFVLSNFLERA